MWWILLLLVLGFIVWIHYARGMSLVDRILVALEIIRTSEFSVAEGYADAAREDPDLVGWIKAGNDCVMLFRSGEGEEVREIVDFSSASFHPGLIIHYENGKAMRTDLSDRIDPRIGEKAEELLYQVRRIVEASHGEDDFGCRY